MTHTADADSLGSVIATAPAALRPIVAELMSAIRKRHPDAHMTAWPKQKIISFGFGPKKMSEHYCYIGVQAKHVNLGFYYGVALPDPAALLEGTGKKLRHAKVRSAEDARGRALLALIDAARAERARKQQT